MYSNTVMLTLSNIPTIHAFHQYTVIVDLLGFDHMVFLLATFPFLAILLIQIFFWGLLHS